MKVVALAGGVGGARLAQGLAQLLLPEELTIVVNTGDDFEHLGLSICPDLDTVIYTLAGLVDPATGWGLAGDAFNFLEATGRLGGPTWFRLGDRDLATHVERSRRLWAGQPLTEVVAVLCRALDVGPRVLPMTDEALRTMVQTDEGELEFQEYFVRRRCQPAVRGFRWAGAETAQPTPAVLAALAEAERIVFCPSNPLVSIDPILGLPGMRERIRARPAVAVSPIIGGRAVKGPAAKMLQELGWPASPLTVAEHYAGLLRGMLIDTVDAALAPALQASGLQVEVTDIIMRNAADRKRLAGRALEL